MDTSCKILGRPSTLPFFCAPAALARMAYPDGECAIARVCARHGIPQCISASASYSVENIIESATKADPKIEFPATADGMVDMTSFFQLYVDRDLKKSEILLKKVEELGCKGIFVTVGAATNGKRELDERVSVEQAMAAASPELSESLLPRTKRVADWQDSCLDLSNGHWFGMILSG